MITINKFGGEILGNPRLVKIAVKRIKEQIAKNQKPIVVVSALAGVTDKLSALSKNYNQKIVRRLINQHREWAIKLGIGNQKFFLEKTASRDGVLSYGEKWSSLLFAELMEKNGVRARRFTGEELGIITDENFGDANIIYEKSAKSIKVKLKNCEAVPVITGFIGKTAKGETTTLGRGGSDTTACLLGSVFAPSRIILWKNVPGVLSADPKIVKTARTIKSLTYGEAEESGKVIHDKAISLVKGGGARIEVTYIAAPEKKTIVDNNGISEKGVKIISQKSNLSLLIVSSEKITRRGALAEIANIINEAGINMALIRNTKEVLYIVVEKNSHNLSACRKKIEKLGYRVLAKEVVMVTAVGQMDWQTVERFNRLLYKTCPEVDLGAFPYNRNCLRLEAIVEIPKPGKTTSARLRRNRPDEVGTAEVALLGKVKKLINAFHKEFIEKRR